MNDVFAYILQGLGTNKQVSKRSLVHQHSADYSQDIERCPVEFGVVLNDSNKAVSNNRNINLYSDSILGRSPKGRDLEMLLDPPEEQFYLPALLIQQGDVFSLESEVVSEERERSLQVRSIVNYSPQHGRILLLGLIAGKAYRLVKQNVVPAIQQVLAVDNLVVEAGLLSDDKKRVNDVDLIQPGKVIIPLVEDVERIRLVRNVIHRIHIMDFSLRDMNVCRYLGYHIKQRVDFDTSLGLPKVCPLEQTQAQVNSGRVERIELSIQNELPVNPLTLCEIDHVVGELLEDPVVPVSVGVSHIAELDIAWAETEMITLGLDGVDDTNHFPKTIATGKLTEHHHHQLVPACKGLDVLVSLILLDDAIKDSLGQKAGELTEDVFAAIHVSRDCLPVTKVRHQFKSTRSIFAYN